MNEINSVINEFNIGSKFEAIDLGNAGGFSGSNIWRIESAVAGSFCLKRWPTQLTEESRIKWIHDILIFAKANGCPEVIGPLKNSEGHTYLKRNHGFWELCPWANGTVIRQQTFSDEQLQSAIETLARFHQATARYFFNFSTSNKIIDVRNRLLTLNDSIGAIERGRDVVPLLNPKDWSFFKMTAPDLSMEIARFLLPYSVRTLPVQPVIRDVRAEHLFFEGNKLVSIIDFGAMEIDNIACDLSRLLGDVLNDDPILFKNAIDTYASYRQIFPLEREIVLPLNHAGVILGITNWLYWLAVENRQFDSMTAAKDRVRILFERYRKYS